MKKGLLLGMVLGIGFSANAQNAATTNLKKQNPAQVDKETSVAMPVRLMQRKSPLNITNNAISVVPIGTAGNCYGQAFGPRTNIWADPNINSVAVIHRLSSVSGHTSGMFGFSYSTDGGATFPGLNVLVYDPAGNPPGSNGRYPQGAIYNPTGNTTATNAYAVYYGPTLAATNGSWGGLASGSLKLDGTGANQFQYTTGNLFQPEMLKIKQTGGAYVMFRNIPGVTVYNDTITTVMGTWNTTTNTYDYAYNSMLAPVAMDGTGGAVFAQADVAFANDGMTGFYVNLAHPGFNLNADSVYMPVIWKTTDGGANWSFLGAIDLNNAAVVTALGLTAGTRLSTGFEMDITVDSKKDLHIATTIHPAGTTAFTIATGAGTWGVFDIRSTDGGVGNAWSACLLNKPMTFRGTFTSGANTLQNDTRIQTSKTYAGDKVFFAYFDTDTMIFGSSGGNSSPDAFVTAFDANTGKWSTTKNGTAGSNADASCHFGMVSEYVFGSSGTYELPIVYSAFTDILQNTQLNYIDGLEITDAEITGNGNCSPVSLVIGVNEIGSNDAFNVSNNYPNPFSKSTSIKVSIGKASDINMDVYNAIGQKVYSVKTDNVPSGTHTFTIDGAKLNAGVYFYTVTAGEKSITKKMIVK